MFYVWLLWEFCCEFFNFFFKFWKVLEYGYLEKEVVFFILIVWKSSIVWLIGGINLDCFELRSEFVVKGFCIKLYSMVYDY